MDALTVKSTIYRRFQIASTYPAFASDEAQLLLNELRDDLVTDLLTQTQLTSKSKNTKKVFSFPSEFPTLESSRQTSSLNPLQVRRALASPVPGKYPRQTSEGN